MIIQLSRRSHNSRSQRCLVFTHAYCLNTPHINLMDMDITFGWPIFRSAVLRIWYYIPGVHYSEVKIYTNMQTGPEKSVHNSRCPHFWVSTFLKRFSTQKGLFPPGPQKSVHISRCPHFWVSTFRGFTVHTKSY